MLNLYQETLLDIKSVGLSPEDVVYIGTDLRNDGPYYSCTWQEFEKIADFEYDNGFGGQQIAEDLFILFQDGSFMLREEYDGSEWWRTFRPFEIPKETLPLKAVWNHGESLWFDLADVNQPEPENV